MSVNHKKADQSKTIRAVEKQIGWDIIHYTDGTYTVLRVPFQKGYKRGRVIL